MAELNSKILVINTTTPNTINISAKIFSDISLYGNYIILSYLVLHGGNAGDYYIWYHDSAVGGFFICPDGIYVRITEDSVKNEPITIVLYKI